MQEQSRRPRISAATRFTKAGALGPYVTSAIGLGESPRRVRARRSSFFTRTVIWVTGLICLALLLASLAQAWSNNQLMQRVQETRHQVQQLRDHHKQLTGLANRYKDPAVIESEARQQMGYIKPGEHPIVIVGAPDAGPQVRATHTRAAPAQGYWQAWWNVFFGS